MLFPTPPTTADDTRAFCQRFNEGIRVAGHNYFVERLFPGLAMGFLQGT
jgi:hypothetical protein